MDDQLLEHFQNPPHEWSDANSEAADYARYDRLRKERIRALNRLMAPCADEETPLSVDPDDLPL